jgi:hypothetical protein
MQTLLDRPAPPPLAADPVLADLRQKLMEREARLREMELAEGTALALLQGQVTALQEAEDTYMRALQSCQDALAQTKEQIDLLTLRLSEVQQEAAAHHLRAEAMLGSVSWRVTRPLRWMRARLWVALFRTPGLGR